MPVAVFRAITALLLVAVSLLTPVWPVAAQNTDAEALASVLEQRDSAMPVAGPLSGMMTKSADFASREHAGAMVGDFSAHVAFFVPSDGASWDFGIEFGDAEQPGQLIVVSSNDEWAYLPYPEGEIQTGPAPARSLRPGSAATLDLVVQGDLAMLAIDGAYAGTMQLPAPVMGDVNITTGNFTSTSVAGRVIQYGDFTVWALPLPQQQQQSQQPAPQPTSTPPVAGPGTTAAQDDQSTLEAMNEAIIGIPPLVDPVSGTLTEIPAAVASVGAGVDVANFHATADFTVPADGATSPWAIGFLFGDPDGDGVRVSVNSLGRMTVTESAETLLHEADVTSLRTRPGKTNTLSLYVLNDYAIFSVNNAYVADFPLPATTGSGDVEVGAGFFADEIVPGRVTEFANFTVRPMWTDEPSSQSPAAGQAPAPATTEAQPQESVDDASQQQFASALALLAAQPPDEGPISGELEETGGRPVVWLNEITPRARDFAAEITIVNPEAADTPWTAGIQFRTDANQTQQIVLAGTGDIVFMDDGGQAKVLAQAAAFDPTPGARNTLQVIVVGESLAVGVNGRFVATASLAGTNTQAGTGVAVVAGVFRTDQIPGRTIAYEDYQVWHLSQGF